MKKYRNAILILWDHLSENISSLEDCNPKEDLVVFLETLHECSYVNHHQKKLAFLLSCMRHFAKKMEKKGFDVEYVDIDQEEKTLTTAISKVLKNKQVEKLIVCQPGEYRIQHEIASWKKKFDFEVEIKEDNRFFMTTTEFNKFAEKKDKLLMESFYHVVRKKTGLLLKKDGSPEGGKWNFDADNRNPIKGNIDTPEPFQVKPDSITKEVLKVVEKRFSNHFGQLQPFWFAVTSEDAEKAFEHFLHHALKHFGVYQDAMRSDEAYLYHSVISHYLNVGLLDPKIVCQMVESAYYNKKVTIQSAEGFIRQILGWREYVRGIYWLNMPKYKTLNLLHAKRDLPWFYWSGNTDLNCLKTVISQTQQNAYSHHIQRLMITGNFALLIGTIPEQIADWYLAVYADAHEWVELPNVLGMTQFADGGYLATKPYASSGSYINKMSNFCKGCKYDVNQKEGEDACPFNYLYWDFLMRNEKLLNKNPRLSMPYATLKKFSKEKKEQIHKDSQKFLKSLEYEKS